MMQAAFAQHCHAICKLTDGVSKIFWLAFEQIDEQVSHNSAVVGATFGKWKDLLKVQLKRAERSHLLRNSEHTCVFMSACGGVGLGCGAACS